MVRHRNHGGEPLFLLRSSPIGGGAGDLDLRPDGVVVSLGKDATIAVGIREVLLKLSG